MNALDHRRRRGIVWLCIAAALLLGVGAPLHGLAHSVQAIEASANKDPVTAHAPTCEQCPLYAALDGAVPMRAATPQLEACATDGFIVPALPARAAAFTAYASRGPPQAS